MITLLSFDHRRQREDKGFSRNRMQAKATQGLYPNMDRLARDAPPKYVLCSSPFITSSFQEEHRAVTAKLA